jgi:hypothetical protein
MPPQFTSIAFPDPDTLPSGNGRTAGNQKENRKDMMKRSTQNLSILIRTGCALLGLLSTTALPMSARCAEDYGHRGLDGHWVLTILQPDGSRFTNLLTFTPKGDIEVFASYRQTQSVGRGTYCRTGQREFTLAIVQLGYNPNNPRLVQNEMATVRSTIKVNEKGDEFTGPNNFEVVDPISGQVLFRSNGGSAIGKLVKPEVP